nr:tyrosine-type recombinase/integrase [Modestobacter versicolor]
MLASGARIGEAVASGPGRPPAGRGWTWTPAPERSTPPQYECLSREWSCSRGPRPPQAGGSWRCRSCCGHGAPPPADFTAAAGHRAGFLARVAGTLRGPNSASGDLRQLPDSIECEVCDGIGLQPATSRTSAGRPASCTEGLRSWVTSHTFRKTVATRLDEAGFTPRQVADQLGHANPR